MIAPQDLIERVLTASKHEDCMVIIQDKTQVNLRWANSTLTTNGRIAERNVTVLVFVAVEGGLAVGSASRADLDLADIDLVLAEAEAAAVASGLSEDYQPLARNQVYGEWAATAVTTGPEVFESVAPQLGDMFRRSVADSIELFGYAEHTSKSMWLGSKGGLRMRFDLPSGRIEMTGKSHNRTRSTWEGQATRTFQDIDVSALDRSIRERLDWQARRIDLPAGRYDTVFPGGAVADLFTYAAWMADARSAEEGRSAYAKAGGGTRLGEKLASLPVDFYSDPFYPGMEAEPFILTTENSELMSVFDNGQLLDRSYLLKSGSLESLYQKRSTAKLYGQPFTPIGDNFAMDVHGGIGTTMDLVKGVEDGLLLTTLWYIRMVNPTSLLLTGLTRDGVYQVKGGEVVGAVNNFRWNESPLDLLGRMTSAGATTIVQPREWGDWVERIAMPPVRFADFNMSTVSAAS